MESIINAISQSGVLALAGWGLAGVLALIGYFDRQRRARKVEDDQVAANLINNLTATSKLQADEIISLRAKEVDQGKSIAHLEGQVKVLTDILQGRDPKTQDLLNQIPEIKKVAVHNAELTEKLTEAMTSFIEKLSTSINK